MDGYIVKLIDILEKEYRLYNDLYVLSRKKPDCIINGDISSLTVILAAEQQLIVELGVLETKREELIEKYSQSKGLDLSETTLTKLVASIDGEVKRRLENVRHGLDEILSSQKEINDLNEKLLKNNLEYIDFSINLMAGQEESTAYQKGGQLVARLQNRNLFDKKV